MLPTGKKTHTATPDGPIHHHYWRGCASSTAGAEERTKGRDEAGYETNTVY